MTRSGRHFSNMPSASPVRILCVYGIAVLALCAARDAWGQLNENCTVSVLNRTVQVKPDGSWSIRNVLAGFGQVRARATCFENGATTSGQSDFFNVAATGEVETTEIRRDVASPIPTALMVSSPSRQAVIDQELAQLTRERDVDD